MIPWRYRITSWVWTRWSRRQMSLCLMTLIIVTMAFLWWYGILQVLSEYLVKILLSVLVPVSERTIYQTCKNPSGFWQMAGESKAENFHEQTHELFPSQYKYCPSGDNPKCVKGKVFDISLVKEYGVDTVGQSVILLDSMTYKEFLKHTVIITAGSTDHFDESILLLESLSEKVSPLKIIYWDLGLSQSQRHELRRLCHVEVRQFNFTNYPCHMQNLRQYAWKAMVLLETLKTHHGALWLDASVRIKYPNHWERSYERVKETGGIMFYTYGYKHPYRHTHPDVYTYLPTDIIRTKLITDAAQSGSVLYMKTKKVYDHILYWYFLCSLTRDCIAPLGSAVFWKVGFRIHRFDQTVLGVLTSNLYRFQTKQYMAKYGVKVRRGHDGDIYQSSLKRCS